MTRLLTATLERGSELLEGLARVDGAHGVVGRVDDDGGGALGDGGGNGVGIDLECGGVGHDLDAGATARLDPDAILREVRGDDDDLVTRIGYRMERDGERGGGRRR